MMSAEERLRKLSNLYVGGIQNSNGQALSVETLLDALVVLYDECCNSTLRREKNISEFVDFGKGKYSLFNTKLCVMLAYIYVCIQVHLYSHHTDHEKSLHLKILIDDI